MKKKTVTITELIAKLESMKEDIGDVNVYVVANDQDESLPGTQIQFWGLSTTMALGVEASTDTKFVLVFRSDEIIRP